ncbi:MAG: hypothetical protein JWO28_2866 [Hyphomicrobiales bacterium]|jgi:hypothetical protein|nr:hypothetical protein [Hyphomicrobiales bacterium]
MTRRTFISLRRRILSSVLAGVLVLAACPVFLTPSSAKDGAVAVDVELVLAVDVSYSMDPDEQRIQRDGYAQALTSPQFLNALKSGTHGKIAVIYVQWASSLDQDVLLPWTIIDSPQSAQAVADKLAEAPYRRAQRTSISGAIDFAVKQFADNGFNGERQVIDVSGDGTNNNGRPVAAARDEAVQQGITINGLPLLIRPSNYGYFNDIANLDEYYEDCVIGGVGAFSIPIKDRSNFTEATRTKLVLEIAAAPPPGIFDGRVAIVPAQAREPRVSCLVGENMWRNRWGN